MKKKLTTLFSALLFFPLCVFSQIYVSPTGVSANDGTIGNPTTLSNAISTVSPGQTIYMRGGVYAMTSTILIARANSGTAGNLKRIEAYSGETPIIDFSAQAELPANRGIILDGFYWYFKGITIRNSGDNGMLLSGSNNTIDNCIFEKNRDTGLQLSRYDVNATTISQWPSNNLILNCESFDNKDLGAENADGFAAKLTCGEGNIFRGCISHNNIDDGWDLYTKTETGPIGIILFENCVAYNNGTLSTSSTSGTGDKNGFKLGGEGIPVNHIVRRCVAFGNGKHGFTDNNNLGSIEMSNNTSVNNAESNFNFRTGGTHQFRNNVSFNSGTSDKNSGTDVSSSNVWWISKKSTNGRTPAIVSSAADFVTLTPPAVLKNADGSPNLGTFATLSSNSDFIDAGVTATGITFNGIAPDLGARETGPVQTTDFVLTTVASPLSGGTIAVNPNNATYNAGTIVTLTAVPAVNFEFLSWSNGATTATTTVTMDASKTITANFKSTLAAAYVLTVSSSPANGGTVSISPNKSTYSEGEVVTLTATPATGYVFDKWSNNVTTATTTVTMNSDVAISALFTLPVTGTQTLRIEDSATFTSGYCGFEGARSTNTGADNGYVTNFSNSLGKGVSYTIKVPTAGVYSVVFRYVNSSSGNSTTAKLKVNGSDAIAALSFPKTTSTTTFALTAAANITLGQGVNIIRLETTVASAFADIDWVEITGETPLAESCASQTATLATDNFEQNVFEAYVSPNPAVGIINLFVNSLQVQQANIALTNLTGQLVFSKKQYLDSGINTISVSKNNITSGLYILTIVSEGIKKSIKVIVQ
ncbi:InlB B-repeat-containing protein [Flavobacterium pectinovorum]|uniref:InlB B-repeat-containing protein n=1 Tax=Flavobacterium pectinovorum TaxID=29533 RepID=UPI001FAD44A2|nr:right-handed parallel beta-helix repeat-containing protein [Flavobacterium pectinovorum]MCI9844821.1 T9SS type A sorting domain-containing protein [Flavobacterium pectinovorum]